MKNHTSSYAQGKTNFKLNSNIYSKINIAYTNICSLQNGFTDSLCFSLAGEEL